MEGVEHVDGIHVVRAYQQAVKFRGEVTCPHVSCVVDGRTDG